MISAIVLAAGLSRRMTQNKLLLPLEGKPIIEYVLAAVHECHPDESILVAQDEALFEIGRAYGFQQVKNPEPEKGQSMSVKLGVAAAKNTNSYLLIVGDQPLLSIPTLRKIMDCSIENPDCIIVPLFDGKYRNPVIFPSLFKENLLALTGDTGGRSIIRNNPDKVLSIEIDDPFSFSDVDTPESYERMKSLIQKM